MATSGQIQTNVAFGYVRLSWSLSSQNIESNTSTLSYTLSIYRSSNISSTAAKSYSIVFNGVTVASGTTTIGGSGTKTIKTGSTTIAHNADGTKTFNYSFSQQVDITWSGSWIGTVTGSGSGTLTTIPRATTPTLSAASTEMGSAVTITMNRASSSFTHTLKYAFGNESGTIGTGLGTSYAWTIPLTLASQIPNATSGTGSITCETYIGNILIGTKSVSFIATVPNTVVPIINSATVTETVTSPDIATKFNGFVQSKSKPRVVTTATGAYGSTITTYKVYIRDSSNNNLAVYSGADVTIEPILISGTIKVVVSVTDSRGRAASYSQNITVLAYEIPKITTFSAIRCNADGTANYEGTRANITLNFSISQVNSLNDKTYTLLYRIKGAETWTTIISGNVYSRNDNLISESLFNADNAYELKLQLEDFFYNTDDLVYAATEIPTAYTLVDFRSTGKGIAFGKVSEKDVMEVALDAEFTGQAKIYAPTSAAADGGFLRLYRKDGTLLGFLATSDNGNGLNLHMYSGGSWSGMAKLSPTGQPYFSSPVPIDSGGTGATTNSGARKNIGVIYSDTDGATVLARGNFTANGTNNGGGVAYIYDTSDMSKFIIIAYNLNAGTAISVTTLASNVLTVNYNNFGTLTISGGSGNYKFNVFSMTNV